MEGSTESKENDELKMREEDEKKVEGEIEISLNQPILDGQQYTVYICKKIVDNLHPDFVDKQTECYNTTKIENNKFKFTKKKGEEYSIIVRVWGKGDEENFIYTKFILYKPNNDVIFFIMMGSFAFVIIFVFILIFYIINKRKKNNPDIDDEDYNKIPVLRETINEDES